VREYLEIPLHRPWHVVVPVVVVTAAAVALAYTLPRKYVSSTLILVEAEQIPASFVERTGTENSRRLQTVRQEVLSRTRLERVIQELDPYPGDAGRKPLGTIVEGMREAIAIRVKGNDAFAIEYVHRDPQKAMVVANRLATLFIEEIEANRGRHVAETSQFIESRLEEARHSLEATEESLRRFKEKHMGTLPEQLPANLSTLNRLQLEQQNVGEDLRAAQVRLATAEAAAAAVPPTVRTDDPEVMRLRGELAALRTRYTDEHPDVQALLSRLQRLEGQRGTPAPATDGGRGATSAALQQARLEVRTLQARQADLVRRASVFEARVDETPRTEQELQTLTRDHQKLKDNYLTLLNKKMSAHMAEKLETQWTGERFRMLDPAALPERPIFPRKLYFLIGGLALGLAVGLAAAAAAELVDPTVKSLGELHALFSEPILATVPHIAGPVIREAVPRPRRAEVRTEPARRTPEHRPQPPRVAATVAADRRPAHTAPPSGGRPRTRTADPQPADAPVAPPAALAGPSTADILPPATRLPPPLAGGSRVVEAPEPALAVAHGGIGSAGDLWGEFVAAPGAPEGGAVRIDATQPLVAYTPAPAPEVKPPAAIPPEPGPAPLPDDVVARLVVDGGRMHGTAVNLEPGAECVLGSAARCDLALDLGNVDAAHARVVSYKKGVYISDLGSARGTYVNGRRIVGDQLLRHGDAIFLGPPGSRQSPRVVVETSTPKPPARPAVPVRFETVTAPRPATPSSMLRETPRAESPRPAARIFGGRVAWVAAALAVAAAVGAVVYRAVAPGAPRVDSVTPSLAAPGDAVTLSGTGFDPVATGNVVHVAGHPATVTGATLERLTVTVPPLAGPGDVPITVERAGRRSTPRTLRVPAVPQLTTAQPQVVRPGDEVTLLGRNLGEGPVSAHLGGTPAEVLETGPGAVRVRVPEQVALVEGAGLVATVKVGEVTAPPLHLVLGTLPLVTAVNPPRGQAGERVTIDGHGFDPQPQGNVVTFGDREALVFTATPNQLTVAAPSPGTAAGQFTTEVRVRAAGALSRSQQSFTLVRMPSGIYVPRFFAAPVPGHAGHAHAFVSTELGPVLLLTGPQGATPVTERAARAATLLNALVTSNAKPLALELRDGAAPGVGLAGSGEVLVVATPEDASGYQESGEAAGRPGAPPALRTIAAYWTALLQDHLALFVQRERPTRVLELSTQGHALADLYREASRRAGPGAGVPATLVAPLLPSLAESVRTTALALPADDRPTVAAAVVGRWQGTMEEGDAGPLRIEVRLGLDGGRLQGSLSRTTGTTGIALETRLKDVQYGQGAIRFTAATGGQPLTFEGEVKDEAMTGSIYATAVRRETVGFFTLRYVQ
jgi:polysaccharide chain length determinant protein (PEP-CTERM system associated)